MVENGQRSSVKNGRSADSEIQIFRNFQIVVEDIGAGIDNGFEGCGVSLKIRNENLYFDVPLRSFEVLDELCKPGGPPVRKIVPGDGCDNHIGQVHPENSLGYSGGFIFAEV
jgi:hypothetical protein